MGGLRVLVDQLSLVHLAQLGCKAMAIRKIELTDEWAPRNLTICVRRHADLPIHARDLVRHLAAPP